MVMSRKRMLVLGIILLCLCTGLMVTRLAVYGFDFGLMSVWFGDKELSWGSLVLDGLAGATMVDGIYLMWVYLKTPDFTEVGFKPRFQRRK